MKLGTLSVPIADNTQQQVRGYIIAVMVIILSGFMFRHRNDCSTDEAEPEINRTVQMSGVTSGQTTTGGEGRREGEENIEIG